MKIPAGQRDNNNVSPLLDKDFFVFALKVPESFGFTRHLQGQMITVFLTKVASVAWVKTRMPLNAGWVREVILRRWNYLNKVLRKDCFSFNITAMGKGFS